MISVQKRCETSMSRTLRTTWLMPRGVCAVVMGCLPLRGSPSSPRVRSYPRPPRPAALDAQARVQRVADRVAHEVESHHRDEEGGALDLSLIHISEPTRLL